MSALILAGLTPPQADGTACVWCGADFTAVDTPSVPVGRSETGAQVFACAGCRGHVQAFRLFEREHAIGSIAELQAELDRL